NWLNPPKSSITAARPNSLGARVTRSRISPTRRSTSRVRIRRLAMPTWPIFSSPACSKSRFTAISGSRRALLLQRPACVAYPGYVGQVVTIGFPHPLIAAQVLEQHAGADIDVEHGVLPDLAEAEAAMEQQRRIGAVVEEHLAGHLRVAQLGVALRVGI